MCPKNYFQQVQQNKKTSKFLENSTMEVSVKRIIKCKCLVVGFVLFLKLSSVRNQETIGGSRVAVSFLSSRFPPLARPIHGLFYSRLVIGRMNTKRTLVKAIAQ